MLSIKKKIVLAKKMQVQVLFIYIIVIMKTFFFRSMLDSVSRDIPQLAKTGEAEKRVTCH